MSAARLFFPLTVTFAVVAMSPLAGFFLGCAVVNGPGSDKDTEANDSGDTGGVVDTAETGETGDTSEENLEQPQPEVQVDTVGPALPACTASAGAGSQVALSGVLLLPDGPTAGVVVYDQNTGAITCVGECDTTEATVICTEGVVSPGLVDPHNHLQYNTLPTWQVGAEFSNRYDWQGDGRYWDYREAFDEIAGTYDCEIMKWAEARAIVHGTTSAVGSTGEACINRGVRNLDEDEGASHLDDYYLRYSSSNVTDSVEAGDGEYYNGMLADGSTNAVVNHVAEGRDGTVRREIDHMTEAGMVGPGQVFVHATDATTQQLAVLGGTSTGILWSPRSNIGLYATTTPVETAERFGVPWAIGGDWTPSGSVGQPQELACAEAWLAGRGNPLSDVELFDKVTTTAAAMVGADGVIGSLAVGMRADIAVFDYSAAPYRAVIGAAEETVRLVVVDGEVVYGLAEYVDELAENAEWCDTLDACGAERKYCLKDSENGDNEDTLSQVESTLSIALGETEMGTGYEYAGELFGLFACADERAVCVLAESAADDVDGDGILDATDVCTYFYDPEQLDIDADGLGDVCDACPLNPGVACSPGADDYDGDGVANTDDNCELLGNVAQTDGDSDGLGDICDPCPDEASIGACTATISDVRQGAFPQNSVVSLSGVVVTAVRAEAGFVVQDVAGGAYSGIYVYDYGSNLVAVGDMVDISGTYIEYYGLSELIEVTVSVTGAGALPAALESDACTLAADAEPYESVRVHLASGTVTDDNADSDDGSMDYDEFVIDSCLRIDDWLDESIDQPTLGTSYSSISGVLTYSFDNFKLAPHSAADLVESE